MTSGGTIDPRDYGLENLPLGIFSGGDDRPRPGVAFADQVVDLDALVGANVLDEESLRGASVLNAFLARGPERWRALRSRLQAVLGPDASGHEREQIVKASHPRERARMHLPVAIGDYVDFYSSLEHATNLGRILRPGTEPLLPNYRHLPIGYHGRSGTVVAGGTPIRRPHGQHKLPGESAPAFGPTRELDLEVELGWIAGPGNVLGEPIPADDVRAHVFGFVLLNDWSARDIQSWEYQPLGPFLGKSFATSIAPWIVPLDALEPFRCTEPVRDPQPAAYLRTREPWAYEIELDLLLQTERMRAHAHPPVRIARTNTRGLYWTVAQQLAHVTSNGATIRPGDLFGSGTISGAEPQTQGSLIELTWRGTQPLTLPGGETRGFLADGDTVIIRGRARRGDLRIGFGEVTGTIVPASP